MGAYLDVPRTEKETDTGHMDFGGYKQLPFAVSSMQGWRKTMEDAHIAIPNLETQYDVPEGTSMYAVFDGHGGKEVSIFCARHFVKTLTDLDYFKKGMYKEALIEAFHKIDEMLVDPIYKAELNQLSGSSANDLLSRLKIPATDDDERDDSEEEKEDDLKTDEEIEALRLSKNSLYDEFRTDVDEDIEVGGKVEPLTEEEKEKTDKIVLGRADSLVIEVTPELLNKEKEKLEKKKSEHAVLDNLEEFAEGNGDLVKTDEEQNELELDMNKAESKGTLTKAEALNLLFKMFGMNSKKEDKTPEVHEQPQQPRFTQSFDLQLPTHAGTTACVALIINGKLYVANAGDSRAVLCRNKKAQPMSYDHKPQQERESSRIEKAGGWVTPMGRVCGNLNLSRCIGDLKYKLNSEISRANQIITAEPDVEVIDLTDEDTFLVVACDGVWDILSNDGIVDFVSKQLVDISDKEKEDTKVMHNTVEEIFTHCICDDPMNDGKGGDNMTAVVVCLRPLSDVVNTFKA